MGDVVRIVLSLACLAFVLVLLLNVFVPRRINSRNGMYVREWWRITDSSRGGGDWPGGFYG